MAVDLKKTTMSKDIFVCAINTDKEAADKFETTKTSLCLDIKQSKLPSCFLGLEQASSYRSFL